MEPNESSDMKGPRIRRGKVDSLTIYEITDSELEQLEQGTPANIQFNFAVALLTSGASFLTALLTTQIEDTRLFCVFVIITVLSLLLGAVFGFLWWQKRGSVKQLIQKIRERADAPNVNENLDEDNT